MQPADDPLIGQLLDGKYRLVSRLGAGGMGKVYRAEQVALGRLVAVKVLDASPNHRDADPAVERRFFLEASLSAKLSHPNVITVHDYGRVETESGPQFYLVMELLQGQTLHARLQRGPTPMSQAEAVSIAIEIARGLRAAHKAGLVHRDLKPANIMLVTSDEGTPAVKILDFGLVKQLQGELREDITQEGTFLGSPRYMAPEQVSAGHVDHRCDLYALGVILFQCLVGKTPFEGKTPMEVLVKHVSAPVPAMSEVNPAVSVQPALEALVRRLLEKSPAARFEDADAVVNALREVTAESAFRSEVTVASKSQSGAIRIESNASQPIAAQAVAEQSGTIAGATITASAASGERRRMAVPIGIGVGAIVLALVGVAVVSKRERAAEPRAAISEHGASTGASSSLSPRPVSHGVLRIETTPPGAVVVENGTILGTAPLEVQLDTEGPARRFALQMQGHVTQWIEQPPSGERVTRAVTLTAAPVAMETPAATTEPGPRRVRPTAANRRGLTATNTPSAPAAGGDDIRLTR
jgi:serine/threonine protein kinase